MARNTADQGMYRGYKIDLSYVWADRLWKARVMEGNTMRGESNQTTPDLAIADAKYLIDRMVGRATNMSE